MSNKKPSKNNNYTPTEFGTLLEEMNSKIDHLGEGLVTVIQKVDGMDGKLERIGEDVETLKMDVSVIKDVLRTGLVPRIERLEAKVFKNSA